MVPALLFLGFGVPLAALLDRVGFFASVAEEMQRRRDTVSVGWLWVLAALTTAVLNLDTTIVLLTPLYVRLARRCDAPILPIAAIPLFLASFASSVLPVSNLTTLIVAEKFDVSVAGVVGHLALPSIAASLVGWVVYRRRFDTELLAGSPADRDARALSIGTVVVVVLLIGFVVGPNWDVKAWMVAAAVDLALVVLTGWIPWRGVPLATIVAVGAVGLLAGAVITPRVVESILPGDGIGGMAVTVVMGTGLANVVNNLPAVLVVTAGSSSMSWTVWGWLAGVNVGAALLPLGALANLLWLRIIRAEGIKVGFREYANLTVPIVVPALLGSIVVLAIERTVVG